MSSALYSHTKQTGNKITMPRSKTGESNACNDRYFWIERGKEGVKCILHMLHNPSAFVAFAWYAAACLY